MAQKVELNGANPQQQTFLPLQLATKYYVKWDSDIQVKSTQNGYYKCLQGQGQVQFLNGNIYKGKFFNGLMHGEGEFLWKNGLKYKGPFFNNCITGQGLYQWQDGSWYKGGLEKGKRHGKGQYYCAKDKSKYIGQWKHGMKHGYGLLQFNQDTSYQGYFEQGLRHGKGKMKYASGNVYEGQWNSDKKSGFGIMNWFSQNQKYQGQWLNDFQHNIGSYFWFDGKIQYKIIKNIYKGQWINGQRQGYGSLFYSNGYRYEGYFDQNKKNGYGLVMDENGNIKLEYFEKDKLIYTIPQSSFITSTNNRNSTAIINVEKVNTQKIAKLTSSKSQPNNINASNTNTPRGLKLLPSLQKSSSKQNGLIKYQKEQLADFTNQSMPSKQEQKYKVQENIYSKCLDLPTSSQNQQRCKSKFPKFVICRQIMNFLLRQNSRLRQWYKHCSLSTSSVNNGNSKDFYTGVTIQSLFKLIKDIKIIDQFLTIPRINRQFSYKGWKSVYEIVLPSQKKLIMIKDYLEKAKINQKAGQSWQKVFNNQNLNYQNIEWLDYAQKIQSQKFQIQQKFELNVFNDIHNPKKIILFRHFVCYLLKIAFLQCQKTQKSKSNSSSNFQKQFRNTLQKLFKTINTIYQTAQKQAKGIHSADNLTFVSKQRTIMAVSDDFSKLNEQLWKQMTKNYRNLNNFSDNTVNVKLLYQLLQKFGILKQPSEKIFFLEKIQRFMESQFPKGSLLRKDLKNSFPGMEKIVFKSPYFQRILNYSLIEKQFEDLLYIAVNRKISSFSKEQAVRKYKQVLEQITLYVRKELSNPKIQQRKNILKLKKPLTKKDELKLQLIRRAEEKRLAMLKIQNKKQQQQRQAFQRVKMQREDSRWEQDLMEVESDSYFD